MQSKHRKPSFFKLLAYFFLCSLWLSHIQLTSGHSTFIQPNNIKFVNLAEQPNYLMNDSAVFHCIIQEDNTTITVSFSSGENKSTTRTIDSKILKQEIIEFRQGLENYGELTYNPEQAKTLYNWIIKPFTADLEQIKTLVFIPEGIFASVPMAALHDGEKFLIEKYAIATINNPSLIDTKTLKRQNLRALIVGLAKDAIIENRKYPALNNVALEISQVEAQIPGSKQLLNEEFTRSNLQQELNKNIYPIIHIATHGMFGNVPEDTFLVTGDNHKITIPDLYSLLYDKVNKKNTVELLTLTACETAIGNDATALGLAGIALQAGVKSVLASLWSVDDGATVTLVTKFYKHWLHQGASKAEALRAAQQALISAKGKNAHPAYWAAFVLVGNWL